LILREPIRRSCNLIQHAAVFPLTNPGIVSIPVGFLAAVLATLCSANRSRAPVHLNCPFRANTGLGAEKAVAH
jgi:cation/acetate symporter